MNGWFDRLDFDRKMKKKRGKTNSFIQSAGQERLLFRRTATPDDEDGKWVSAAPVDVLSRPLSGFVSAISAAFSASRHVVGQNSRAATHTHTETACVCVCVPWARRNAGYFLFHRWEEDIFSIFVLWQRRGRGEVVAATQCPSMRCAQVSFSPEQRCSLCVVTIAPPHNNTKSFFLEI